jgi:hypothetical protein
LCVDACVRWVHVVWRFGQRETERELLERRLKKRRRTKYKNTHTHKTQTQTQIHASALPLYSPTAHSLTTCVFRPHCFYIYSTAHHIIYILRVPASQPSQASHSQPARKGRRGRTLRTPQTQKCWRKIFVRKNSEQICRTWAESQ